MKNKNGTQAMLRDAGILFAITLIAGLVLGFVYELTKEPIRTQQELKISRACKAVFEDASEFKLLNVTVQAAQEEEFAAESTRIEEVYEACGADGTVLGYVVSVTSSAGYGGDINLFMGIRSDGTLNGISILKISETPGLGMEAGDVLVPQFKNKKVSSFSYTKSGAAGDNQIDAISGATITTKAVTNAVNTGLRFFAGQLKEGGGSHE